MSAQHRVAQLRAAVSQNQSPLPPRPPPIRRNNTFLDQEARNARPWTAPPSRPARQQPSSAASPAAVGSTAPVADPFGIPSQIEADMSAATGGAMRTWDEDAFLTNHRFTKEPELRLRPSTGRTVQCRGQTDFARGLRLLERAVTQNRVRQDERDQRFHERPALKRKRLLRERWRERFKQGFYACIQRSRQLKAQGW
jgi:small subunit ribosomal protein MRP21